MDPSASTEEMDRLFQPSSRLLAMAAFEAALAAASAEAGVVPKAAAAVIADVCASESFDADEIFAAQRLAGNPAIPFVRQLTVRVGKRDATAAAWVHFGATSQDVVDSATMLLARDALAILRRDLQRLRDSLALLAAREAETPMIGRTLLQQAIPTSLGFKLAGWLAGLDRAAAGLADLADCALALQLGGPVGTLSAFGEHGARVAREAGGPSGPALPRFRPGIRSEAASPRSAPGSAFSPGFWARSPATSSSPCRRRSPSSASLRPPARAAPAPCPISAIRS